MEVHEKVSKNNLRVRKAKVTGSLSFLEIFLVEEGIL